VLAAYLPENGEVRIVDENMQSATRKDFAWCDAVLVSGMHIQAPQIHDICTRAHACGRPTVLGGPSVSSTPQAYGDFDILHLGELGDATDRLIEALDEDCARRPAQLVLTTQERVPLCDFPQPAYHLVPMARYFIGSLQFSSGCPYRCEFCDIPELYGRQPRLKTPQQIIAELDAIIARPHPPAIYFVDDNFIGNRKAARECLPHLIAWQERNGFPVVFACEATLNIAKQTDLLAMMRRARFDTIFVGIETPEIGALQAMDKGHNTSLPMLEAIRTLNSFGIEVVSGIILGLDTDTPQTEANLIEFIERSQIPMLTINLLQALPRTPLWDRLKASGRLVDDSELESNVDFLRPYGDVVESWRRAIGTAYAPDRLLARYQHQVDGTYAHRIPRPVRTQLTLRNLLLGLRLAVQVSIRVGLFSDYRRAFWRLAAYCASKGQIESAFAIGLMSYHLIRFAREASLGRQNASFYASKARTLPEHAPAP
jgi:radical SAM superfamily enzyme YgiQ (UPF0313 family)